MAANLRLLQTARGANQERVVTTLEAILAEAKAGKVTGLFLFVKDEAGTVSHHQTGISDALIVFWMDLIKHRLLRLYK